MICPKAPKIAGDFAYTDKDSNTKRCCSADLLPQVGEYYEYWDALAEMGGTIPNIDHSSETILLGLADPVSLEA